MPERLGLGIDHAVDALALDHAGLDRVDADVVGADFHRQALAEAYHAPLRCGVRGAERKARAGPPPRTD